MGLLTGWKTLIVAALVALVGVLQGANWIDLLGNPQTAGWVVTGLGVVMGVLRLFTNTPPGKS